MLAFNSPTRMINAMAAARIFQALAGLATAVSLAGCMSVGQSAKPTTPFITIPPPPEGVHEIVLLAAMQGRIVDRDGCLVLRSKRSESAVIFASRFRLDRASGTLSDGVEGGRTIKLGQKGRFSGGSSDRRSTEAWLGEAFPITCPDRVVQIDEVR